jgi:hypothetical protein
MRFRPSRQPTGDIAAEPAGYLMKPRGRFHPVFERMAAQSLGALAGLYWQRKRKHVRGATGGEGWITGSGAEAG